MKTKTHKHYDELFDRPIRELPLTLEQKEAKAEKGYKIFQESRSKLTNDNYTIMGLVNHVNTTVENYPKAMDVWCKGKKRPFAEFITEEEELKIKAEAVEDSLSYSALDNDRKIYVNRVTQARYDSAAMTEDELKRRLGRQWKHVLTTCLPLIDKYKYLTRDVCTPDESNILPIPTNSKELLRIYANPMTLSRKLIELETIGALICVSHNYYFGCDNPTDNECRLYIWNKPCMKFLTQMAQKYDLWAPLKKERYVAKPSSVDEIIEGSCDVEKQKLLMKTYKIGFSSKTNICGVGDDLILATLEEKYNLSYYQKIMEKLNLHFPESMKMQMVPNLKRTKKGNVTKIGIRCYSGTCMLRNDEKYDVLDKDMMYRGEFLSNYFEGKRVYGMDVNASIYRITYLMNNLVWDKAAEDFYVRLYGHKFTSSDERKAFKIFCMRLYFDRSNSIFNHIYGSIKGTPWENKEDEIKRDLTEMRSNMIAFIGDPMDSEVFYHESCVYLLFLQYCIETKHIKMAQVYDGFYSDDPWIESDEAKQVLSDIAEKYAKNWKKRQIEYAKKMAKKNKKINKRIEADKQAKRDRMISGEKLLCELRRSGVAIGGIASNSHIYRYSSASLYTMFLLYSTTYQHISLHTHIYEDISNISRIVFDMDSVSIFNIFRNDRNRIATSSASLKARTMMKSLDRLKNRVKSNISAKSMVKSLANVAILA